MCGKITGEIGEERRNSWKKEEKEGAGCSLGFVKQEEERRVAYLVSRKRRKKKVKRTEGGVD